MTYYEERIVLSGLTGITQTLESFHQLAGVQGCTSEFWRIVYVESERLRMEVSKARGELYAARTPNEGPRIDS